jgi:hypothetical protein
MGKEEGGWVKNWEEGIWRRGGDLSNISIYRLLRNAKVFFS